MRRVPPTLAACDQALEAIDDPMSAEAAELWRRRGDLLRQAKRPREARHSFDQALVIEPDHPETLSAQGTVLALLGRREAALEYCDRALQAPYAEGFNARGLVHLLGKQLPLAIADFDRAIALDPKFGKAWHNRALALTRLGKEKAALESVEQALALADPSAAAQGLAAFLLIKQGRFEAAIAPCEAVLAVQPNAYPTALYHLVAVVGSGQAGTYFAQRDKRQQLGRSLGAVIGRLWPRLLILALLIGIFVTPAAWAAPLQTGLTKLLSVGIIALMLGDLWRHRQRWRMIGTVYFRCGIFTYLRAVGILIVTVGALLAADRWFPPFMHWGWANLIFDQPGNIIFQPFNLFSHGGSMPPVGIMAEQLVGILPSGAVLSLLLMASPAADASPTPLSWAALFTLGFWLLLILGIPFWARLEEHIFRRGANTWRKIAVRSTQFGLVHLVAGIPLLGGVVLIVPGFLFACRYKSVYERHLRQHHDIEQAQEAGVVASTADHAVYNAILVSLVAGSLLAVTLGWA